MTSGLLSVLTFLLGLLLGNRLAIGRDKRKEFNEAAAPIRGWLLKDKDDPSPFTRWPSTQEIDIFIHYLSKRKRINFLKHLKDYKEFHTSMQSTTADGRVYYSDTSEIRRELNELFKYTKPK